MSISPTTGRIRKKLPVPGYGDVSYLDSGEGAPALFVHGVFLNADLWRHQLEDLADIRRCVAVDLLAHGESDWPSKGSITFPDQAAMLLGFLDAAGLEAVDLVANDSGGAIAQLLVARAPHRVRSLTLTNCDTHDNWPPPSFRPVFDLATQGALAAALGALASDPALARDALAAGLEHPERLSDDVVLGFIGPFSDPRRAAAVQGFVANMDHRVTVDIRADLERFNAPTLVVWGTADEFFETVWATWLAETIPGTVRCVEVPGAKLFFPWERPEALNGQLRRFWSTDMLSSGPSPGT